MTQTPRFKPDSIYPLQGVDPSRPQDDLVVLDEIVANAKIVGLGEPTHGQKEINQLRDRITRYLIEHQGFRVVAMEDSAIRCRIVNDFIVHGQGTTIGALSSQSFWTWKTREVLAMIEWLRGWNVDHADDPVRFIGIDIQDIATPASELFGVLSRIDLDTSLEFNERLTAIGAIQIWDEDPLPDDTFATHMATMSEIRELLETSRDVSPEDLDLGLDCVLSIEQTLRLVRWGMPTDYSERTAERWNRRDDVMATRALAPTLDGDRVILWAHNGHVQSEQMDGLPPGAVTMGQVLRAHLSLEYCVISGVFGSGSYRAINTETSMLESIDVGDPPVNTIDHELWSMHETSALIVDLQAPGTILFEPQTTRWAGAALASSDEMIANVRPALGSNAIAFVREATPSVSL